MGGPIVAYLALGRWDEGGKSGDTKLCCVPPPLLSLCLRRTRVLQAIAQARGPGCALGISDRVSNRHGLNYRSLEYLWQALQGPIKSE